MGIQEIRSRVASEQTLAGRAIAFFDLAEQEELTWKDLLAALDLDPYIATHAAMLLHHYSHVSWRNARVIKDKHEWEEIMRVQGINVSSGCPLPRKRLDRK